MQRSGAPGRRVAALAAVTAVLALLGWTVRGGSAVTQALSRPASPSVSSPSVSLPSVSLPSVSSSVAPSVSVSPSATAARGPGGTLRVVGLGDSVPAGSACGCTSYVTLTGQGAAAAQGRTVAVTNFAQGGLTTSGLATQLGSTAVRRALAAADLVIVTIGANDLDAGPLTSAQCAPATDLPCYRTALAAQATAVRSVLQRITDLTPAGATVLVTGYWNVFLDGAVGRAQGAAYVTASNALTLAVNAGIAGASSAAGALYVDIYTPFKGDGTSDDTALLAPDGDHPSASGHALIASALLAALG